MILELKSELHSSWHYSFRKIILCKYTCLICLFFELLWKLRYLKNATDESTVLYYLETLNEQLACVVSVHLLEKRCLFVSQKALLCFKISGKLSSKCSRSGLRCYRNKTVSELPRLTINIYYAFYMKKKFVLISCWF